MDDDLVAELHQCIADASNQVLLHFRDELSPEHQLELAARISAGARLTLTVVQPVLPGETCMQRIHLVQDGCQVSLPWASKRIEALH